MNSLIILLTLFCPLVLAEVPTSSIAGEIMALKAEVEEMKESLKKRSVLSCPGGYTRYKKSCYRFVMARDRQKIWDKAEKHCQSEGAHLVTVDRKGKERFIKRYLKENFHGETLYIFTGLISTNEAMTYPFDPPYFLVSPTSSSGQLLAWRGTRKRLGAPDWAPRVKGQDRNPQGGWDSCITILFDDGINRRGKAKVQWHHKPCNTVPLPFICEVRLP